MSGPTKTGEPSMEEILASIRKIIADDPSKPATEAAASAPAASPSASTFGLSPGSPALAGSRQRTGGAASPPTPAPDAGNRTNPSFGRLSEALRTTFSSNSGAQPSGSFAETRFGQSAPLSPLSAPDRGANLDPLEPVFGAPTDRARSIDSELDDILDEPLVQTADAKKPDSSQGGSQWAVWRTQSGKSGDDTATPTPAGPAAEPTALPPASPSQPSLGRPTGGFYPTSGGGFGQPSALPSSTPSTFGKTGRFEPALPSGDAGAAGRLGSLVPKRDDDAPKAAAPAMARSPRFEPNLGASSDRSLPSDNAPGADRTQAKPAPVVIAAMPSPVATAAPATLATPASMDASSDAANRSSGGLNVPLPPRTTLFSRPLAAPKAEAAPAPAVPAVSAAIPPPNRTQPSFGSAKPVTAAEPLISAPRAPALPKSAAQVAASASALDALAAGFAASNVQVTPAAALPAAAAPPAPAPATAPASEVAVPGVSAPAQQIALAASGQPRTLEDMVADMVKPMLQKWLTDNMPRIIEKALRSEAGQPGAGGPKLPGT